MQEPRISVVVPVHEMAGKLQNLEKALKESYESMLPIQFLLLHDGNDSHTAKDLHSLSAKYHAEYYEVNLYSPGLTRNMGLKYVRAPWVTFWDSDDQGNPREVIAAVSKANTKSKVLIGGYRVMNLENQTYSKLLTPDANLSKLMMNPGGWRFIFRRDFIGEVRFPSTAMGEDQIFLARLKIQARDIELVNECFYTYFVGSSTQLTKKSESVVELKESILELENLIIQNPIVEKYIYVINARMAITAFKKRVYSGVDLAKYVFGDAELTWRKRLNWIAGFLKVINFRILRSGPGLC